MEGLLKMKASLYPAEMSACILWNILNLQL